MSALTGKRARALSLAMLILLSVPALAIGGIDTATAQEDHIEIADVNDLQAIEEDPTADYVLVDDIDAAETETWNGGSGFVPISSFSGTIDGNGHTISNLHMVDSEGSNTAMIAESDGVIRDLTLEDVYVSAEVSDWFAYAGLVAEMSGGQIDGVDVTGHIDTYDMGGEGTGGVVGFMTGGEISDSTVDMTVEGGFATGGLVGDTLAGTVITDSATHGSVDSPYSSVGGLIGGSYADSVERSYSTMDVSGDAETGGLIGMHQGGDIDQVYANGNVSGGPSVGGLVGSASGGVAYTNAYATGDVSGTEDVGGLFGRFEQEDTDLLYTFATGSIDATSGAGPLVGNLADDTAGAGERDSNYFDTETTGFESGIDGSTGLTTDEMTGDSAEDNMGSLDFSSTWETTDRYPDLSALGESDDAPTLEWEYYLFDGTEDEVFDPSLTQVEVLEETDDGKWEPVDVGTFGADNRIIFDLPEGVYAYRMSNTNGDVAYVEPFRLIDSDYRVGDPDFAAQVLYVHEYDNEWEVDEPRDRIPGDDPYIPPPLASFGINPAGPVVGETVEFDASNSYSLEGDIVDYRWTINGDEVGSDEVLEYVFDSEGTYDVGLEVEDSNGGSASTTMGIYAAESADDAAPAPDAYIDAFPETPETGEYVELDGSLSVSYTGGIDEYRWKIGDNEITGETISEAWSEPGVKTVELVVTDENGAYQSTTTTIVVHDGPVDDEVDAGPVGPLEPGDGILPGSISGLSLLVLLGSIATVGVVYVDQRTSIDLPIWALATPAGILVFLVVEAAAPGTITIPLMRAFDTFAPMLFLAAIVATLWLIRGWRDDRRRERIESLTGR